MSEGVRPLVEAYPDEEFIDELRLRYDRSTIGQVENIRRSCYGLVEGPKALSIPLGFLLVAVQIQVDSLSGEVFTRPITKEVSRLPEMTITNGFNFFVKGGVFGFDKDLTAQPKPSTLKTDPSVRLSPARRSRIYHLTEFGKRVLG